MNNQTGMDAAAATSKAITAILGIDATPSTTAGGQPVITVNEIDMRRLTDQGPLDDTTTAQLLKQIRANMQGGSEH